MRYYKIILTNAQSGQVVTIPSLSGANLGGATWSSQINGQNIGAAQNIELEIFSGPFATPSGNSIVTVWGVSIAEIQQAAANFTGLNIQIFGGMAAWAGNPGVLASQQAKYAGPLLKGTIFPGLGNWIGTDMWVQFIVVPGFQNSGRPLFGSNAQPANIAFNWKKGQSLSQALTSLFGTAFPGVKVNVNINANVVAPQDLPFQYNTMEQFSSVVMQASKSIVGGKYSGVQISYDSLQNQINVWDGTRISINKGSAPTAPKTINFADLIGQPTWLGAGVTLKCAMRADLTIGSQIQLPSQLASFAVQTPNSALLQKNRASFQGSYFVTQTRHVGNFRDPSPDSWVTIIDAAQLFPNAATNTTSNPTLPGALF